MPKYRVFISERLIHTHLVEAEDREALADMIGDMEAPIATECVAYELVPELTEEMAEPRFEIQVLDDHGQWRDDLVSGYTEDNRFTTVADAEAAMKDLIANGDPRDGWNGPWRVAEVVMVWVED